MALPSTQQLERLLGATFGQPVRIHRTDRLSPWAALRCELDAPAASGLPGSVIVKFRREGAGRADPRLLATERAALEFLAEIDFPSAPRLIAAEADTLVMQDLAPCAPLADLIRLDGPEAARTARLAFARTLGALGAATAGKSALYDRIRARHGDVDPLAGFERGLGPDWPATQARLGELGLPSPEAARRELGQVVGLLARPGPFGVLTNGDPEPNNFLVGPADGWVIDFEGAAYQHALTCAVWIHVPGPAWMRVADPLSAGLEDAYRAALAMGVPQAEDDRLFGFGLAAASLAWALERLVRFSVLDARPPGEPSRAQMVATLEAAADVARRHRALPHLAGWARNAADWLRRRWPDADIDLAALAPYAARH